MSTDKPKRTAKPRPGRKAPPTPAELCKCRSVGLLDAKVRILTGLLKVAGDLAWDVADGGHGDACSCHFCRTMHPDLTSSIVEDVREVERELGGLYATTVALTGPAWLPRSDHYHTDLAWLAETAKALDDLG